MSDINGSESNGSKSWNYSDAEIKAINQELALFSVQQRGPIREHLWDAAVLAVIAGMNEQLFIFEALDVYAFIKKDGKIIPT